MSDEEQKPVIGFKLEMIGRLNPAKPRSAADESALEGKRRDQERVRRLSAVYDEECILRLVYLMRTSKDENVQLRCIDRILNRSIGLPKAVSEEERKGADAHSLLDVLAALSGQQANLERGTTDAPAIQHNPTIDNDSSAANFFDELERSRRDDDIVDGELVSG